MGNEKKKAHHFCDMHYSQDENGKETLIKDGRFQVMMEWERPYMEACIDRLEPSGDVLEIGFGCGYSSTHIQTYLPKSHTIIEYHPVVIEKAKEWAKGYENITLVEDTWQEALHSLGLFDEIFFDDYPLESSADANRVQEWSHLMKEKEPLMQEVREQTAFLSEITYSDEDLDEFFDLLPTSNAAPIEYLLTFFCELRENNQITDMQQEYLFKKLQKKGGLSEGTLQVFKQERSKKTVPRRENSDRLSAFFNRCADKHMRQGSCFSCFINDPIKFHQSPFFQSITTDPTFSYEEELISVAVPENCSYYEESHALVIKITKN